MSEPRDTDGIEDVFDQLLKPQITDADRIEVVFDHLINLTDQVGRLAAVCRAAGIDVPADVGTLGPADAVTVERLTRESIKRHFPNGTEGGV